MEIMSRCKSCDIKLTESELTRKNKYGEYEDLCNQCFDISLTEHLPQEQWKEHAHEKLTHGPRRFFSTKT